jgi:hypothetical protein
MRNDEAKQIVLALDGLAAHIETIRTLVVNSIEKPVLVKNNVCQHLNSREIQTHGGESTVCDDCGFVGVLDLSENNE